MRTGERVAITFEGQSVEGVVLMASPNGRSLVLGFEDTMLGGYGGSMPVLREEGSGVYYDLISGSRVWLRRLDSKAGPPEK